MWGKPKLEEPLLEAPAPAVKPSGPKRLTGAERMQQYLEASALSADTVNPEAGKYLRLATPVLTATVSALMYIAPFYMWLYSKAYQLYCVAPTNVLQLVFGAALCFYGGTFVASIAAIEAFRQMGWQRCLEDVHVLMAEASLVTDANAKDDQKDDDGDGIADVDQISPAALAQRKSKLVMMTIKDPRKVQAAVGSLWAAYLAVLATLRLQFAQTTAIALGIVEVLQFPLMRVLAPVVATAMGPDLKHWVETVVDTGIKVVAVIVAWYVQMIISAFYSAVRGGRLFADGLVSIVHDRGWERQLEKLPFVKKPFHPDTSYLDEAVGYSLATVGFVMQVPPSHMLQPLLPRTA